MNFSWKYNSNFIFTSKILFLSILSRIWRSMSLLLLFCTRFATIPSEKRSFFFVIYIHYLCEQRELVTTNYLPKIESTLNRTYKLNKLHIRPHSGGPSICKIHRFNVLLRWKFSFSFPNYQSEFCGFLTHWMPLAILFVFQPTRLARMMKNSNFKNSIFKIRIF